MLVLSRKPGEKINIGPDVVVTVVRVGPNTVRLGIEAPMGMNIVRTELVLHGEEWKKANQGIEAAETPEA